MLHRKTASDLGRRGAELAPATTAASDLDDTERRAMPHDRDFLDGRLFFFWVFYDPLDGRTARHDPLKKIRPNALDLAVDQIIDIKVIQPSRLLQLPRAWTSDHDLWPVLPEDRVLDDLHELGGVYGHQVLAREF